jgi:hypothetical protein
MCLKGRVNRGRRRDSNLRPYSGWDEDCCQARSNILTVNVHRTLEGWADFSWGGCETDNKEDSSAKRL